CMGHSYCTWAVSSFFLVLQAPMLATNINIRLYFKIPLLPLVISLFAQFGFIFPDRIHTANPQVPPEMIVRKATLKGIAHKGGIVHQIRGPYGRAPTKEGVVQVAVLTRFPCDQHGVEVHVPFPYQAVQIVYAPIILEGGTDGPFKGPWGLVPIQDFLVIGFQAAGIR